jgi:hypothetical protein
MVLFVWNWLQFLLLFVLNWLQYNAEIPHRKYLEAVGGQVFQQPVGIPIGTDCAPLLTNLFLYLYEVKFIQKLLHKKKK